MNIVYVTLVDISKPTGPGTNELESILALNQSAQENVKLFFLLASKTNRSEISSSNFYSFNVNEKVYKGMSLLIWQIQYLRSFISIYHNLGKNRKDVLVILRPDSTGRLSLIPIWLYFRGVKFGFRHFQGQIKKSKNVKNWYRNTVLKWGLNGAKCIDCSQKEGADQLILLGYQNVHVVGNAVNLKRFHLMDRPSTKAKYGFKKDSFIIGYIGGVPLNRGADLLIKSAPQIINKIPDVHFVIVGDSKYRDSTHLYKMQKLAKKMNVERYFTFTGTIPFDEVLPYFNCLNIGVALVSSQEVKEKGNSSQKIYQYLATGSSIIIPKNTHEDLVEEGVAVQIIPESIREFIEAVVILYHENIDREIVREVALKYSVEDRAKKQLSIWKNALKNNNGL
ncbi:glycosyltransferase [Fulvivirga sp.]|uniref:glycosyltransferase n=1 Tax=Fulvivirga sp. TaxID=1931237 RepID=UPI0032ECD3AF